MAKTRMTVGFCVMMILFSITSTSMLQGSHTPCEREGDDVNIPGITDLACIHCYCRKGYVQCDRHDCDSELDGCHAVLFDKPKERCCDVCKGCQLKGRQYPSGATWRYADDPCVVYQCQAGVLTQSSEKCHVDCDHPIHLPGQCCASCSDCFFDGVNRSDGEIFRHNSSSDVICTCKGGRVQCVYRPCPVLNCPPSDHHLAPGQRCPQCKGQRKIFNVPSSCFFAKRVFAEGTLLRPDHCTTCTCHAGTVHCHREACPPAPCDVRDHVFENGTCCPKCPDQRDCHAHNSTYPEGHHWLDSVTCQQCHCRNGVIQCRRQSCPQTPVCDKGHSLQYPPGVCCALCIKDDAVCSVSANSHHVTFDARAFRAHGTCRYQLSRDCRRKTFFVKIRNSPHARHAFWTELVTVGLGNATVINLYRSFQARVNRHPVVLPHVRPAEFAVRRIGQKVVVDAYEERGVKVTWDGASNLEVTVSKTHRNSVCGLCGNNNGDPGDDFRDKRGAIVDDADDFLREWHVRGQCQTAKGPVSSADLKVVCPAKSSRALRAEKRCGGFFHKELKACSSMIDILPYVRWCLYDACLCPRKQTCHVRSIRSLVRRCKRAGIHVRWWRVAR